MKKTINICFAFALLATAVFGIKKYYDSLPIRGSYETKAIDYPKVDREHLRALLDECGTEELERMKQAGLQALQWQSLLKKVKSNVVADVVKNMDEFFIKDRYPKNQCNDFDSHSSYYYHSHRPGEHGHFHIFYSDEEKIKKYEPIVLWDEIDPYTHIVAISMHPDGEPISLFLPNQWVTSDDWYSTEDTLEMASHFEIGHPYPSWPSNQWVNQMLKCFRPQLKYLYQEREKVLASSDVPIQKLVENRKVNEMSSIPISMTDQMDMIDTLLSERSAQKLAQ